MFVELAIVDLVDRLRFLEESLLPLQSIIRLREPHFDSEGPDTGCCDALLRLKDAEVDEGTNFCHRQAMIVDDRCGSALL
jgi:hypothetical protein